MLLPISTPEKIMLILKFTILLLPDHLLIRHQGYLNPLTHLLSLNPHLSIPLIPSTAVSSIIHANLQLLPLTNPKVLIILTDPAYLNPFTVIIPAIDTNPKIIKLNITGVLDRNLITLLTILLLQKKPQPGFAQAYSLYLALTHQKNNIKGGEFRAINTIKINLPLILLILDLNGIYDKRYSVYI